MKMLSPIALALALAFPVAANAAASNADLQKEIDMLKAQLAEIKKLVVQQAAKPAPAPVANNDTAALKAEVAAMRVKMDAMEDAKTEAGFDGIKVSGYIDPTYMYSKRAGRGQFLFMNPMDGEMNDLSTDGSGYMNSNLGGVTLKIEKSFDNGMMATLKLRPHKGANTTLVEEAYGTVPFGEDGLKVLAGKMNSFNGYETIDATDLKTVTHSLGYDFGGPWFMTGAGLTFDALGFTWKTIAGNMNSDTDLPSKANHNRGFHWRGDMELSEFAGWGASGMHGTVYGESYHYGEADFWFNRGDWTFNGQLEASKWKNSAANGKDASHLGASFLAAYKLGDGWEAVARADWLDNHKNGGGTPVLSLGNACAASTDEGAGCPDGFDVTNSGAFGDYRNGFGPGMFFDDVNGWILGNGDKGAKRSAITLGLNYQYHENALLKFEVRHDMSDLYSFYDWKDKDFKKSNTTFAAQTVIKF